MKATLTSTSTGTFDLPVRRVTWTTLQGRRFGSAMFAIPRGHAAYSAAYVAQEGGSRVVFEDATLGVWEGITLRPAFDAAGVTVEADHIAALTRVRLAPLAGTYDGLTAGALFSLAAAFAVAGLGRMALRVGAIVEAAPVVERYSFSGQPLSDVLGDLQERTGQEAWVADGALSWGAPKGTRYEPWLIVGSDITGASWRQDADQRVAEVVALNTGVRAGRYRARDAEAAASGWPVQALVMASGSDVALARRAETELAASRRPRARLTGHLAARHWALREGDVATILDAGAGFGGRVAVGRVVARTWELGVLSVEIQIVEDAVAANLAAIADRPTPDVVAWDSLYRNLAGAGMGVLKA